MGPGNRELVIDCLESLYGTYILARKKWGPTMEAIGHAAVRAAL